MLLRAGIDIAVHQVIRHPAPARPSVRLVEHKISGDVHAPQGNSLRNRPLHAAAGRSDGKPFRGSPEGSGCIVVFEARVCVYVSRDARLVRRSAQADHLGVVTDGNIHMVAARKEEQGRPLRPKLIVLLRRVDPVNRLLHFRRRHPGAKQQNIGPEIRRGGPRRKSKKQRKDTQSSGEQTALTRHRCLRILRAASW